MGEGRTFIRIPILLFADDMVLLDRSQQEVHGMLDTRGKVADELVFD